MDKVFAPKLTICGIEELADQRTGCATHVLSLVDPELPEIEAFQTYGKHHRTTLRFHDVITDVPERVRPRPEHVESVLAFGMAFQAEQDRGAPAHLLVHCHMGVSRSTAAMLALMAQSNPAEDADSLFGRLVTIRPQAWPNSQMISFADEQLGRNGDLTAGLGRHYGRQIRRQPQFTEWMTRLGRQIELQMAVVD